MVEIIPAIMPKSFSDLEDKISQILGVVEVVQIDLMDGKFVPSSDWPYSSNDSVPESLPNINEIDFEIDLMIENPVDVASAWASAGAKRIIPHLKSLKNPVEDLLNLKYDGVELGLAINTTTPNEKLEELIYLGKSVV